jgi:uracil-DNA glycosylase
MPSASHEHPKATILFVGDPPKFDNQLRDGHPFQGKVAQFFKDGIETAEIPAAMMEKTFCCVSDDLDKLNTAKQMTAAAATSLYPRLIQTKPLVVVACGASALKVICGDKYKIKDWAGKHFAFEFEHEGETIQFLVFVSWSPGFLIHNDHLLEDYYRHFIAIKALATNFDKEMEKQAEVNNVEYDLVTDFDRAMKEIDKFDKAGQAGKVIAWDLETSGLNPHAKHSRIGVLSMSIKERTASVFIWDHVESDWSKVQKKTWLKRVGQFFKNKYKFVAHNGKFDCKWIKKKCGVFPKLFADTQLLSYCLDETPGTHGLKALAVRHTDMGSYEDELGQHIPDKSAFCAYLTPPISIVGRYAGADADCTLRLYNILTPLVEKKEQFKRLGFRLLPKASNYLSEMEYNGAKVDLAYAQEYADELTTLSNDLLRQLRKVPAVMKYVCDRQEEQDEEYEQYIQEKYNGHKAKLREWKRLKAEHDFENKERADIGKRPLKFSKKKPDFDTLVKRKRPDPFQFNVNSGDQLRAVLFDKLRYNPVLETDSGQPSTNKETLIHFKNEMGCKFSKTLLDYRLYSKILNTFIGPMVNNVQGFDTGYFVYSNLNLTSTVTGRLSCVSPDTLIDTDRGTFCISELPLDLVGVAKILTHNNRWRTITHLIRNGTEMLYEVETTDGRKIKCTAEHRLLVKEAEDRSVWKRLRDLKPGDEIVQFDASPASGSEG